MIRTLAVALVSLGLSAPALAAEEATTPAAASAPAAQQAKGTQPAKAARKTKAKKQTRTRKAPDPTRPVNITAQLFEVMPETKQAVWKGNVVVERDDLRITCDVLTATYGESKRLDTLVCLGRVHMVQRPGAPGKLEREAWGDRAVFDNAASLLTLTGNPRAREGANSMRGTEVTYHVDQDRLLVKDAVMVLDSAPEKTGAAPAPDAGVAPR